MRAARTARSAIEADAPSAPVDNCNSKEWRLHELYECVGDGW
jgi:hypothetical protein